MRQNRFHPLCVAARAAVLPLFLALAVPARAGEAADAEQAPDASAAAPADAADAVKTLLAAPPPEARDAGSARDAAYFEAYRAFRMAGAGAVAPLKAALAAKEKELVELAALKPDERRAAIRRAKYSYLLGAALLYRAGGLDEAAAIARIWEGVGADGLATAPRLAYDVAFQAARSADARAYPLLAALLADPQDGVRLRRGPDQPALSWPDTHVVLWAAAGADAEPALLAALADADLDETALAAAAHVAGKQAIPDALPAVRRLAARAGAGLAKCAAVETLGVYGHPDDFAGLRDGLKAAAALPLDHPDRGPLLAAYINALGEYGDLRAADDLRALLGHGEPAVRDNARRLLAYLLTPDGLAGLREAVGTLAGAERADADLQLAQLFAAMGIPAHEYDAADDAGKKAAIDRFRRDLEADFATDAAFSGPTPPAADLIAAYVVARSTTLDGDLAWVRPHHVLRVATMADRPGLLAARQAIAGALDADAVEELDVLSAMLVRLLRATYRQNPGFTEAVAPVAAP